jgi:hypothetical protein
MGFDPIPWALRRVRRVRRSRAFSIVYTVGLIVVLAAFASLAVDVGRIRLAAAEVQNSADAAARAGADSLPISTAKTIQNTSDTAAANGVIDEDTSQATPNGARINPGIEIDPDEDLEFGIWNPNATDPMKRWTWIATGGGAITKNDPRQRTNAVHVTARRIRDRDNSIPLILAQILPNGPSSTDINRDATAYVSAGPSNFGFVGIDKVDSNGNGATVDSWRDGKNGTGGGVGSDGNINLGNGDVYGDARPGTGKSLNQGPNSEVTGWTYPLDYKLADRYPPVAASEYANATPTNPNPPTANQPLILAGGATANTAKKYICSGLKHPDPFTANGYIILYVNGDVDIQGSQLMSSGNPPVPAKIQIRVIGAHSVDLGGSSTQYCQVYAPQSTVTVHGTPGFYGQIVGKTLTFKGTSNLHYDEDKKDRSGYTITLVK